MFDVLHVDGGSNGHCHWACCRKGRSWSSLQPLQFLNGWDTCKLSKIFLLCVCTEEKHVNTMQAFVHIQRFNIKLPGIEVGYAVCDFQAELLCWHTWTDVRSLFTELASKGTSCRPYINLPAGDIGSAICSQPTLPPTLLDAEEIESSWQTPTKANSIRLYHYCNRIVATWINY
jgi:hypothetical protein